VLKINNLSCTIKNLKVLDNLNLEVHDNEILGITGGPCCGKSLLLSILAGHYKKYTGDITLAGVGQGIASAWRLKNEAALCQSAGHGFNPEATVTDTVISGCRTRKSVFSPYTPSDREAAARYIEQLGIAPWSDDRLKHVSESILRMTLIASSLMKGRGLLLLDSPEAGSGYRQRLDLLTVLKKYAETASNKIIIASTDLNFIASNCDRIIVLEKGRIAAQGTADMIDEKFMKRFFSIEAMISRNVVTSLPEIHVIE
jgi:ABC-type cobalamin/Fe3+-siderophores transport system ATPase subunit